VIALVLIPDSSVGFELPKLFCAAVCAALLGAGSLREPVTGIRFPGRTWLFLFAASLILAIATSIAPLMSVTGAPPRFLGFIAWVVFLQIFFGALALSRTAHGVRILLRGCIGAFAVVTLYGLVQYAGLDPFAEVFDSAMFLGRIFSTTGHPNTLAQFLVLLLPLTCVAVNSRAPRTAFFLGACGLVVLMATGSRSGMVALGVMIVCTVPLMIRSLRLFIDPRRIIALVACVAVVGFSVSVGNSVLRERFSRGMEAGRSVGARSIIWPAAVSMIIARPMGYGPETMALVSPQVLPREIFAHESLVSTVDRAHNIILDLLIAFGPLGFLGFLGFCISLLFAGYKHRTDDPLIPAASLGLIGFFVTSLFGFPTALTWVFFFVVAGILAGTLTVQPQLPGSALDRAFNGVLLLMTMAQIMLCGLGISARLMLSGGQMLEASIRAPFDREVLTQAAETHLRLASLLQEPDRQQAVATADALIARLMRLTAGHDGIAYGLQAWSAGLKGDRIRLDASLEEARRLLPWSVIERRVAAEALRSIGDFAAAAQREQSVRDILPPEFFREGSALRRIFLKENPWLMQI